jgi:hypothetical protein
MKRNIKYLILVSIMVLISSCSDDSGPRNAVFTQLNDLVSSPGFEWFQPEFEAYVPDTSVISQIKTALKTSNKSFVLFVNPSCACVGTQKQFPAAVKVLKEAGINEPNFKIFTFTTVEDLHPYLNQFKVRVLPCLFTMQDTISTYSVIDSLNKYSQIDTLARIENYLLKALK